jgi:hypothetical protein
LTIRNLTPARAGHQTLNYERNQNNKADQKIGGKYIRTAAVIARVDAKLFREGTELAIRHRSAAFCNYRGDRGVASIRRRRCPKSLLKNIDDKKWTDNYTRPKIPFGIQGR